MGRRQRGVSSGIDQGQFFLGVCSPEHKDCVLRLRVHGAEDRVGQGLPALSLMRCGLIGSDRQHGVEEQHALFGPRDQTAGLRFGECQVGREFFEDVV